MQAKPAVVQRAAVAITQNLYHQQHANLPAVVHELIVQGMLQSGFGIVSLLLASVVKVPDHHKEVERTSILHEWLHERVDRHHEQVGEN